MSELMAALDIKKKQPVRASQVFVISGMFLIKYRTADIHTIDNIYMYNDMYIYIYVDTVTHTHTHPPVFTYPPHICWSLGSKAFDVSQGVNPREHRWLRPRNLEVSAMKGTWTKVYLYAFCLWSKDISRWRRAMSPQLVLQMAKTNGVLLKKNLSTYFAQKRQQEPLGHSISSKPWDSISVSLTQIL